MTKILLVEDDKSLREIYGVRLLAEGYDIVSAGDGEEALAMAIKERPSLIVSDVMMPKISGFDMLDILRSTTETKDIKVIMMTALSSEDQRQRGERLGADRYLVKSQVGIEDVVRTVHEVLADLPGATTADATQHPQQPAPAPVQAHPTAPHIPERPSVESLSPQQPTVPQQPAAPQQPAPQPTAAQPAPVSPFTQQPAQQQPTQPAPATLPQPTAPFSSQTPRPSNLGDRVIHPIETPANDTTPDLAQLMEQELSGTGIEPISIASAAPQTPPEPTTPTLSDPINSNATPVSSIPVTTLQPAPATPPQPSLAPQPNNQPQAPQPVQPQQTPVESQSAVPAPNPFPPTPPQQ